MGLRPTKPINSKHRNLATIRRKQFGSSMTFLVVVGWKSSLEQQKKTSDDAFFLEEPNGLDASGIPCKFVIILILHTVRPDSNLL